MISLARFSIRRPAVALTGWLVLATVLTLIGLGVSHTVSPSVTVVPGTQSARAQKLADATFGPTQLMPILLEGPTAQLNRQGPRLVAALARATAYPSPLRLGRRQRQRRAARHPNRGDDRGLRRPLREQRGPD